jgi:aldose 1-epimerase
VAIATIGWMSLTRVPFGLDRDGRPAEAFVLRHARLEAWLLDWGATLARLRVADVHGRWTDVVLGLAAVRDYQQAQPYLGAVVGRHANRIREGRFELDGRLVALDRNDGAHHLHGGPEGFDRRTWMASVLDDGDAPALEFALHSADGDQGYPGALEARVVYRLAEGRLHIDYLAAASAPTPVNLTQHAYFDLSGRSDIRGQQLRLAASRYLPVDAQLIPTGEIRDVAGSAYDFRAGAVIGERLQSLTAAEPASLGFDHCFVLDGAAGALRTAAELHDPASGRRLRLLTDQPGLQVYTGNFLDGSLRDREGARLQRHAGLCLEPQRFPDGPNHAAFPDAILRPGEVYRQACVLDFPAE